MSTIYNLSNPSDPHTLESDNFLAAAVAVLLLGNGEWGIEGTPALFGWFEWLSNRVPQGLEAFMEENRMAVAAALDSVLAGTTADRLRLQAETKLVKDDAARIQCRDRYYEQRLGTVNIIGRRAWALAAALRGDCVDIPPAASFRLG